MARMLVILGRTRESRWNHGDHRYGGYNVNALQLALRLRCHDFISLMRRGREMHGPKPRLFHLVLNSQRQRLVLIGQPPGQVGDIRHAISRVRINGVYYLIDSDNYGHMRCTEAALRRLLARIDKSFAIEERIEVR
ncbi:hypothetical protein PF003_g39048 [Phytophthora fragariae]|nr:hypothetical protein PF003_g39048 [Phytophthora fragariae]